jgi:hypothetical protein
MYCDARHAPYYDPYYHQCYWFCNTIWRVLSNPKYQPSVEEKESWKYRGKYHKLCLGKDSLEEVGLRSDTEHKREEKKPRLVTMQYVQYFSFPNIRRIHFLESSDRRSNCGGRRLQVRMRGRSVKINPSASSTPTQAAALTDCLPETVSSKH